MAGNAMGAVKLTANDKEYTLWLGMSVLADVQAEFGDGFEQMMVAVEQGKFPNLAVVHSIFLGALQRYHADEADRWLVDDLISQNPDALGKLMSGSTPEPEKTAGKRKAAA